MRQIHRIILSGSDLRAAILTFLGNGEPSGPFPSNAKIRCLTQSTLKNEAKDDRDFIEIYWGGEDSNDHGPT